MEILRHAFLVLVFALAAIGADRLYFLARDRFRRRDQHLTGLVNLLAEEGKELLARERRPTTWEDA